MPAKPARLSTIEQSRIIPADPIEVYWALTDPLLHAAFTGSAATGRAVPGRRFTAWDGYISGRTIRVVAGKRIVQEWRTTDWPKGAPPSLLEWRFAAHPRGARVTLRQTRLPAGQAASYRSGWITYYWNPLRKFFDRLTRAARAKAKAAPRWRARPLPSRA